MDNSVQLRHRLYGFALIAAPILLALSTFFWEGPEVGRSGGMLQVVSYTLWIPAFLALLDLVRPSAPRLAVWMSLIVFFACIGGNNWGMDGIFASAYNADQKLHEAAREAMGPAAVLTLLLPGLLFPVTMIVIGIALLRSRAVPSWCALLLVAGGIAFPISRIPRIELLAHAADLLLIIPSAWIGLGLMRRERDAVMPGTVAGVEVR